MAELKDVFEGIMALNRWNGEESISGPGSTLGYTVNLRSQLPVFLREFGVKRLFDAPCGDFNWMREVAFPEGSSYVGGDVAPSLIERNRTRFESAERRFLAFDIVKDQFPEADLWFCRDCLFHLSYANILSALGNFCRSNIPYMMTTTHLNTTGFANTDIPDGEFRLIDLYLPPVNLPREALFRIADYVHPFPQREMVVWTQKQVEGALRMPAHSL